MASWRNATGRTLSSPEWLEIHHRAKLSERRTFAEALGQYRPRRLVDLGCATGLWLDLLDGVMAPDCDFVGVDSDFESLARAEERSASWNRKSYFLCADIAGNPASIPSSDLLLAFNVFPYISDVEELLKYLHQHQKAHRIVVRQYDGALIRLGPMSNEDREVIDSSLYASLESSSEFSHYDMDRAYEAIHSSEFDIETLEFEVTQRHAPFPEEFADYFQGTVEWIMSHISEEGRNRLERFLASANDQGKPLYVLQNDLVAVLSAAP